MSRFFGPASVLTLIGAALFTSSCRQVSSQASVDSTADGDSATVDRQVDTPGQLTEIGQAIYELERRAVTLAFPGGCRGRAGTSRPIF